jgi:uncharacterized protein YndB with AHSA1/START domain
MNEEGELRLSLDCVLEAPREQVFRGLTDPTEVVKWWGPHGFTLPKAEIDLRVGGGYRFVMKPPEGDPFHVSGRFLSIDPPRLISYTFRYEEPTPDDRETVVTLALEDHGRQTVVFLTQGVFATQERLLLHRDGWSDTLERLKAVLDK